MTATPDDAVHVREPGRWSVRDPAAHNRGVRRMFARIARVYDLMNHLLSLDRDRAWRRRLVDRLAPGTPLVLDLCAGTGDLGLAALRRGRARRVVAADFTPAMLRAGRRKGLGRAVPAVAADTQRLPFRDACADAVVVGFGVRNLADLRAGLAEMRRVLRPGGRLLVLDFFRDDPAARGPARGKPAWVRWLLDRLLPLAGRVVARDRDAYGYLAASMDRFVTPAELAALMREAGFTAIATERLTLGIAHIVDGEVAT